MLCGQINFHISVPIVRHSISCCRLMVNRNTFPAFPAFNHFLQFFRFLPGIHPPPIIPLINHYLHSIAGLKCPFLKNRIVFFPEGRHILAYFFFIQRHTKPIHFHPVINYPAVQYFLFLAKQISNTDISQPFQLFKSCLQALIFQCNFRPLITARFLQVHPLFQFCYGCLDSLQRFRPVQLISLIFLYYLKPFSFSSACDISIFRLHGKALLKSF